MGAEREVRMRDLRVVKVGGDGGMVVCVGRDGREGGVGG